MRKGKRGHKLGKKEKSAYVGEEVMRVQSPKKRIVQREKVTQTWKKEKSAYVEEEVERKTTRNIKRHESTDLSLLARRLDTNFYFYWSFLRLNCSCSAALGLDCK